MEQSGTAVVRHPLIDRACRKGYGTHEPTLRRRDPDWYIAILVGAIHAGFRHFDSAQMSGTEELLGEAVRPAQRHAVLRQFSGRR